MNQYEYDIYGEDYIQKKVIKIGKSVAVSVPKEWYDSDVIVIKAGDIRCFKKIDNNKKLVYKVE